VSASGGQAGVDTVRTAAVEGHSFDVMIIDLGIPPSTGGTSPLR
jgi:hypothetical protein